MTALSRHVSARRAFQPGFCVRPTGDRSSLTLCRRHFLFTAKDSGGTKERDVRKCLRKIPELSFLARIVLLGKKSQIVSHIQQALEQFARFFLSVEQVPAGDQPKGAWDKNSFTPGQSVHAAFLRPITQDETIFHQLPFDGLDRVADTFICCRQKADEWHCQQAGVQRIRTIKLSESLSL